MKYIPVDFFTAINSALNFSTPDKHVIGACDIYATKAAGGDKKLYREIEQRLQAQLPSTSSVGGGEPTTNSPRPSPFGDLNLPGPRHTFAYLIATLNASHTDYDFSLALHPEDFKRESSLKRVMYDVDTMLKNLRPNKHFSQPTTYIAPFSPSHVAVNSAGNEIWGPQMWSLINREMDLRNCEKYSYSPEIDPFEGVESGIESMHYFFFNKDRKRVCYLYLRTLSVISHSPTAAHWQIRRPRRGSRQSQQYPRSFSAHSDEGGIDMTAWDADVDDDDFMNEEGTDILNKNLDDIRADIASGKIGYDAWDGYYDDFEPDFDEDAFADEGWRPIGGSGRSYVRGISEEIGDTMDMDMC